MAKEESFGIIPLRHVEGEWYVLLIHQKNGNFWGFPKGHPEENESPHQAAIREFREETGLEVDHFLNLPPFVQSYLFHRENEKIDKGVTLFAAVVKEGEACHDPHEIYEVRWLLLKEAPLLLTYESQRSMCHQLMQQLD